MARKKQHLRYQAKKGRLQSTLGESAESDRVGKKYVKTDMKNTLEKSKKNSSRVEFTKLPASETQFVRREIFYIGFTSLVLAIVYIIIFFAFRYTGLDEWLSSFIRLGN